MMLYSDELGLYRWVYNASMNDMIKVYEFKYIKEELES